MELDTKQLQEAVQTVVDSKAATEQSITEVKSTLDLKASLTSVTELQTKNAELNEALSDLQEQVANLEVKGTYSMDAQTKTFDLNAELKSLTAANPSRDILAKGLTTADQASAGITIRTTYEAGIIKPLREMSPFLSLCSHKVVPSEDFKRLVRINGAEMRWGGENVANGAIGNTGVQGYAEVQGTYGKAEAHPFVTNEMLHDSAFDLQAELSEAVLEEIAVGVNDAALNGDGVKKPKGLLAHIGGAAHESFEQLTVGAAGKLPVATKDILKQLRAIQRALKTGYRQGAVWVMNEEMRDELAGYVYTDGRSIINDDVTEAPEGRLLGRSIVVDSAMPAGTIVYGDVARGFTFLSIEGMTVLPNPYLAPGNTQFYHSMRVGTIVGDVQAVKIVTIKAA
ncbi:phage major capsid protein [Shewanella frigidimarina]|uniref:phage major capsid protein n=1 Tax=Shewanella frigidimarina TaxID=56812 RepID=UPI003D7AA688